jgi:serine/threonine protein kinase
MRYRPRLKDIGDNFFVRTTTPYTIDSTEYRPFVVVSLFGESRQWQPAANSSTPIIAPPTSQYGAMRIPQHCRNRFAVKMSSEMNFNITVKKPMKYGFYHPEGNGFLHIKKLGHGVQGTATLVRDVKTGALVVRKRSAPTHKDKVPSPFADQFRLPHAHIIQLLGAQNYQHSKYLMSSTTYWPYANDSDLYALVLRYGSLRVPEVVIWQYLSQMLDAYEALHKSGKSHNDGHCGNIFVHWDGTSVLPEFILGDLGFCADFPVGLECVGGDASHPFKPKVKDWAVDEALGELTLRQLAEYDECEVAAKLSGTPLEHYQVEKALVHIGTDMEKLSGTLTALMHDEDFEDFYSDELEQMASMLYNLQVFAYSVYVRTTPRWFALFTQVRMAAAIGLSHAIDRATFPVPGLESFGPAPVDGRPELYDSVPEVLTADVRPPGPWYIAEVDPDTLRVTGTPDSVPYCAETWYCTDSMGFRVRDKSSDSSTSCSDEPSGTPPKSGSPSHAA